MHNVSLQVILPRCLLFFFFFDLDPINLNNQNGLDNGSNDSKNGSDRSPTDTKKQPISLVDVVFGNLEGRHVKTQWVSNNEIIFRTTNGSIVQLNALNNTTKKLVAGGILVSGMYNKIIINQSHV